MSDSVNHPKHYNEHPSGVECITIVEEFNFNIGNAIKYLWRAGLKGDASCHLQGCLAGNRLQLKEVIGAATPTRGRFEWQTAISSAVKLQSVTDQNVPDSAGKGRSLGWFNPARAD